MSKTIKLKQNERFQFIDFCANYLGKIGRTEVVKRFGISDAAASKDISEYIEKAPNNLSYDFKSKTHTPTKRFKPLYDFSATQALKSLSTGYIQPQGENFTSMVQAENSLELNKPKDNIIAQISRAINLRKIVKISYWSLSSGSTERLLAPFAIVDSGLRWHVRAFCRRKFEYRDFVLTRILDAKITDEDIGEDETEEGDNDWNRKVTLKLVPHPVNVDQPEAIIQDYRMKDGCLELEARYAVAGYILRHWNVDSSPDHSEKNRNFQLWLCNGSEIEGVEALVMAPGADKWKSLKTK